MEEEKLTPRSAPASTPITDFGEKIGGAKKDTWSGFWKDLSRFKDDEFSVRPLSEIWPSPDYEKLKGAGVSSLSLAVVRALRDEIPTKPRDRHKLSRWCKQVVDLRNMAKDALENPDLASAILDQLNTGTSQMRGIAGRIDLYLAVGHEHSLEGLTFCRNFYNVYRGRENVNLWVIENPKRSGAFKQWPSELAIGDTKEDAIAAFRARHAELNLVKISKKTQFLIFSRTGEKGYFIGKKIGRNVTALTEAFETVQEARQYRAENLDDLEKRLERYKQIPHERRDTNEPRVGEDMRGGQDVTPEMFAQSFGFKGVEFGNWVEQKRRQRDLNDAYDSLMDMASILGVTPKSLSLGGSLSLAFGARGSGGVNPAAAHYESDRVVINLTKREGAGSLGHEWWHALDNYFGRQSGAFDSYISESREVEMAALGRGDLAGNAVRKEVMLAFAGIEKAVRSTSIHQRSNQLDSKRVKEYWTTRREVVARAFESYLLSKLGENDASNDYLVNVLDQKTWDALAALGLENEDSYPYPTESELPAIRQGFDQFIQFLGQEREFESCNETASDADLRRSTDAAIQRERSS